MAFRKPKSVYPLVPEQFPSLRFEDTTIVQLLLLMLSLSNNQLKVPHRYGFLFVDSIMCHSIFFSFFVILSFSCFTWQFVEVFLRKKNDLFFFSLSVVYGSFFSLSFFAFAMNNFHNAYKILFFFLCTQEILVRKRNIATST